MKLATVAIYEDDFAVLATLLDHPVETAAIATAGQGDLDVLCIRRVELLDATAYEEQSAARLVIRSSGYVPLLKRAARERGTAIFIHTHPGGGPAPSHLDDLVDEELAPLFSSRTSTAYASLILGGTSASPEFSGRLFDGHNVVPIEKLRVVGTHLKILGAQRTSSSPVFDRQIRAFGRAGQAVIQALRIGVIGAGGTGSAVTEQLQRLGVGEIIVVDDDAISDTNLTRIHQSSADDIGASKVDVAAVLSNRLPFASHTRAVRGRVTEEAIARELRTCDVLFGCTDDHSGRMVLSRLAYWYLIPLIDVGFVIDSSEGEVRGLFGRLTSVGPGSACLVCQGVVDALIARAERLAPDERQVRVAEGYAPGLGEPDPAVVAYTTLIASLGVAELLSRLFSIAAEPASNLLLRLHEYDIRRVPRSPQPGHYCADRTGWATGDEDPFLGQVW